MEEYLTGTVNRMLFTQVNGLRRLSVTALETTGSGLIAALEQTWADLRRRTPQLRGRRGHGTGLSTGAVHIDAKWGHFGADHWKVACGCQPPRSFWIRAKQYTPGPITCGVRLVDLERLG
jgi:hypothetical protein